MIFLVCHHRKSASVNTEVFFFIINNNNKKSFYVISIHLCLSSLSCLPVPPSLLPWNPSVFLTVSCRWSNMTRAGEPIHFHLVIFRHFDLPQCSSISIRGGLLVCVSLCVMWNCNVWSQAELARTLSFPSTCHPPVNAKAIVMVIATLLHQ